MHKIVAGIEQKKIVVSGQLLVTGSLTVCVMQCNAVLRYKQLLQIAIADYVVVTVCYVCTIFVAQQ